MPPLPDIIRDLDATMRAHIRTSVEVGTGTTEVRRATYALTALQELVRNAAMHRTYEGTNSPIHVSWFEDRVEIISPGGPYGDVSAANFGQPGIVSYRNPNLADAMRVSGLVQRYGVGIPLARQALRENNQPEPTFEVDTHHVRCTTTIRPDWRPTPDLATPTGAPYHHRLDAQPLHTPNGQRETSSIPPVGRDVCVSG